MLKNLAYLCEVFQNDLHEIWREIYQTSFNMKYIKELSIVQIEGWKRSLNTDLDNVTRIMNDIKKELLRKEETLNE